MAERDLPRGNALEAIEAELFRAVYDARRRARRQLLGLEPPPIPSPRALALRRRQAGLPSAMVGLVPFEATST